MTDTPRLTNYLDTDSELVFYCPECAEREFGESVSAAFGLTSSSSLRGHRTPTGRVQSPQVPGRRQEPPEGKIHPRRSQSASTPASPRLLYAAAALLPNFSLRVCRYLRREAGSKSHFCGVRRLL